MFMSKKIYLLVLLFIVNSVQSQMSYNRNLPSLNVMALNNNFFEAGKISVKFHRFHYNQCTATTTFDNKIVFNSAALNQLSQQYHFSTYTSLFNNILKDETRIDKHQRWGFDLWFTIQFDSSLSVQRLYNDLMKTNLFEVVEPVYKKHLLDAEEDKDCGVNYVPNDPLLSQQWHYNNTGQANGIAGKDIKLFPAWDIETGKPNVIVAVHDMGIQLDHPDLAQNIAIGKSFNFISNDTNIVMGYHGTHTAGTIAAVNNNGIGVSGIAGGDGNVNSGARLMSVQIFQDNKSAGLAEGFVYAADKGAAISSNSWAYDIENIYEIAVMDAIDYFIENGGGTALQGGLVIFASGNLSQTIRYFPSAYDRVICVAATNNRDTKANYSTFGSWVDIAAPGGDYSAFGSSQVLSTSSGSSYKGDHGTSMACPHVSGVAALIASKLSGKASASDVRDILLSTTDNIDSLNPNYIGLIGTGRLNAYKALSKAETIFNGLNVAAVDSFKAVYNCSNINLNWKKNIASNDVVIAYSNINGISGLVNGKTYNVGDALVGEGAIIYKGNAANFTLSSNNKFLHYFKIWSIDASNNYSFGKTAEIVAPAYIEQSGSIQQNFDFPPYFPTQEWRAINPDNDLTWAHTAADTAHTGAGDLYSMCMYNYQYNTLLGAVDILTSPLINVQNSDSIKLSFWYAYKYRNTGLPIADSLELLVSTDCGKSYISLWKKGGMNLATVSSTTDTAFYPFGIDKWQQIKIDISSFKNNNKILFAFRSVNGKGNNLFLDNIDIDVRYNNDAALSQIVSPIDASCNSTISPQVVIKNIGNNNLTSLKINYTIDGGNPIATIWNGNIKKDDSATISLTNSIVNAGKHQLTVYSFLPNNVPDEFVLNDTLHSSFYITQNATLPFYEGFEGNTFPPEKWYVAQQPVDAISWVKTNKYGSNSSSSAMMQNFVYDNKGRTDDLITPLFSIDRNMDSAFLLFDYAYEARFVPTTGIDFDTLEISISRDCGSTWQNIWRKGGGDLVTFNQTQSYDFNEFFPQANQWKPDSIMIANSFNKGDAIQLRFRNIEYFGNDLYLDNIKVYSKYYAPGIKEKGYAIYPNPTQNYLLIQHLNNPTNLKAIKVFNSVGRTVLNKKYDSNAVKDISLNTTSWASDVYILQLIYDDKTITEKIVKLP